MSLCDADGDRETEPSAPFTVREKWIKNLLHDLVCDHGAIVFKIKESAGIMACLAMNLDGKLSRVVALWPFLLRQRPNPILCNIQHKANQLIEITLDRDRMIGKIKVNQKRLVPGLRFKNPLEMLGDITQVDGL